MDLAGWISPDRERLPEPSGTSNLINQLTAFNEGKAGTPPC
jgi:hypothetical protein